MPDNFFKQARRAAGLTQFEAAKLMDITTSAVSGWERGQVPSISMVDTIARVYRKTSREVMDAMHGMARVKSKQAAAV